MDTRLKIFSAGVLAMILAGCSTPPVSTVDKHDINLQAFGPASGKVKVGKPYTVLGKTYFPAEDLAYDEEGVASWYGPGFHGKLTANGEVYDQYLLTAAHPTLALPTLVEVTNLENGQSVVLKVNDRGPFAAGRIIDLSRKAADVLDVYSKGTARVRVRALKDETLLVRRQYR